MAATNQPALRVNWHAKALLRHSDVSCALFLPPVDLQQFGVESGHIVLDGTPERSRDNEDVKEFYLGLREMGQRKSYHDVKRYKRRMRCLS